MCAVSLQTDPTESVTDQIKTATARALLPIPLDNKGVAPNTVTSDLSETEIHFTGVARVGAQVLQTYQLHSFELANKKRFLRSAFCCCFPMAVNSTDGESGVLRSRQYYIQSD